MSLYNENSLESDRLHIISDVNQIEFGTDQITTFDIVTSTTRTLTFKASVGAETIAYESDVQDQTARIDSIFNNVVQLESDVSGHETRLDIVEGDILFLQTDVVNAKTDIDALDIRLDTVEGDLYFLQSNVATAEGQITAIQDDITDIQNDYLPKSGGTMTGSIGFHASQSFPTLNQNTSGTSGGLTGTSLTGQVTNVGNTITLNNASVISKVLTGYIAGSGTITSSDTILTALQKVPTSASMANYLLLSGGVISGAPSADKLTVVLDDGTPSFNVNTTNNITTISSLNNIHVNKLKISNDGYSEPNKACIFGPYHNININDGVSGGVFINPEGITMAGNDGFQCSGANSSTKFSVITAEGLYVIRADTYNGRVIIGHDNGDANESYSLPSIRGVAGQVLTSNGSTTTWSSFILPNNELDAQNGWILKINDTATGETIWISNSLQTIYDSATAQIITSNARGALTIKNGQTLASDKQLVINNYFDENTFSVSNDSVLLKSYTGPTIVVSSATWLFNQRSNGPGVAPVVQFRLASDYNGNIAGFCSAFNSILATGFSSLNLSYNETTRKFSLFLGYSSYNPLCYIENFYTAFLDITKLSNTSYNTNITYVAPSVVTGYTINNATISPTSSNLPNLTTSALVATSISGTSLTLGGTLITSTPTEINKLTGMTMTTAQLNSIPNLAPIANPSFTGSPRCPNPDVADESDRVANCSFVNTRLVSYAKLLSPQLSGSPTCPTPSTVDNSTRLATTAFVKSSLDLGAKSINFFTLQYDEADSTKGQLPGAPVNSSDTVVGWHKYPLNNDVNATGYLNTGTNEIILPTGTYVINGYLYTWMMDQVCIRLRKTTATASTLVLGGVSEGSSSGIYVSITNFLIGKFTVSASQTIRIEYKYPSGNASYRALGDARTLTGERNIYGQFMFQRVS